MSDKCCLRLTSKENTGGHPSAGVHTCNKFPSSSDSSPTEQENLSQIRMGGISPPPSKGHLHPKGTDSCWVRLGGEAFASISICACSGIEPSPVFGVPGTKKGWRKASRRGLHSTCPGGAEQLLLQDLNHSLMAFKRRRWLHLATQLRICISKERRALPSPAGKLAKLPPVGGASMVLGLKGA